MPGAKAGAQKRANGEGVRKRKSKPSHQQEHDDDLEQAGSQKYRRLANTLETCTKRETGKSKIFLKEFRSDVRQKHNELMKFRQEKEEEFMRDREKFATTFKQLSEHLSGKPNGQSNIINKEDHPLFKQAQENTDVHQSLLKQFKLVEAQLQASTVELPLARWKQDKQEIKGILAFSGRHGGALVGGLLAPEPVDDPMANHITDEDEKRFVNVVFKDSQEALHGETWGQVADIQVKQLVAIAKTVELGQKEQ